MSKPLIRVSQGVFGPELTDKVIASLNDGRKALEPALQALPGLLHYYVAVDTNSNSMVNISVWESVEAARQMDKLPEMAAQREIFIGIGVKFEPIRNYSGLWSIERNESGGGAR